MLIIGELINATRRSVKEAVTNRDAAFCRSWRASRTRPVPIISM